MSEKSHRTIRSRLPRFQGPKKTPATKIQPPNSRKSELKKRENVADKPGHLTDTSDGVKLEKPSDDHEEIPFEPDQQALDSILTNKGISFKAIRASERTPSYPENRLSIMDSLDKYKEDVRLFRESFSQYDAKMKTELNPQTPTSNYNKSSILTPRSSVHRQDPVRHLSITDSLDKFKENVRQHRESFLNYNVNMQTPKAPGNKLYGQCTPGQRDLATPTATQINNHSCKAWTEIKENRPPPARVNHPGTVSASKGNPARKLYAIKENSPDFSSHASKEDMYYLLNPVTQPLLHSSGDNGGAEKSAIRSGFYLASKHIFNSTGSAQPVAAMSSEKFYVIPNSLYSSSGSMQATEPLVAVGSGLWKLSENGTSVSSSSGYQASKQIFNSLETNPPVVAMSPKKFYVMPNSLYSSSGNMSATESPATIGSDQWKLPDIQYSQLMSVTLTPKSPLLSSAQNTLSTDCTWSCQQTVCTPRLKISKQAPEAAHEFNGEMRRIQNTQINNSLAAGSLNLLSYQTQVTASKEPNKEYSSTYATSQADYPAPHLPLSSVGDLDDYFQRLQLTPGSAMYTTESSRPCVSAIRLNQETTAPLMKAHGSERPVNSCHERTVMSNNHITSVKNPLLAVTPSQTSRVSIRDLGASLTPICLFPRSTTRVDTPASCLKNRDIQGLYITDSPFLRNTVSSVKMIRWADNESDVDH